MYSVLMSVYHKEKPEHLRTAMESMWTQTLPTDDFVLVCDGPLAPDLDAVIADMQKAHGETLNVVRLEKNGGLGNALNIGVRACKNEIIARMDSDDISRPERCEKEFSFLQAHPDVSIVGGWIEEFSTTPDAVNATRVVPETNEAIRDFAKMRNPFNHPSVMYRRSAVVDVGCYQDFYLLEDYYLWIRMLGKGYTGYNIQEPLLWMRAGSDMYKRRAGLKYAKAQRALFKYMRNEKFISFNQYMKNVAIRSASSLAPNKLREIAFKTLMRK